MNTWNQVGATYDRNTGVAQLWHDGKMVKSRNIGQIELATNSPIRLGARKGDERYFEGKISCVQIYDKALNEEEIGELRNCPSTKGPNTTNSLVKGKSGICRFQNIVLTEIKLYKKFQKGPFIS